MNTNFEIKINDATSKVEILEEKGTNIKVKIGGREYEIDMVSVEECIYSILYKNKSYNIEIIEGDNNKEFTVNTLYQTYDVEIIDAESRYLESRDQAKELEGMNTISSPMPGRIVRIPVSVGDEVTAGQTVIVVSAMKMESEYKTSKNGIIKQIHVKEGDIVNGNQPLITVE